MSEPGPRGQLFVVATPIGNLGDLSPRAQQTLADADIIACEDTRTSRPLLDRIGTRGRRVSYHDHNARQRTAELIGALEDGQRVALISDAGTPLVSDPGHHLVAAAVAAGAEVCAVPGPSAVLAALVSSGIPADRFSFVGFLPRASGKRAAALADLGWLEGAVVFLEAGNRVAATLQAVVSVLGPRQVAVARELTKKFEEVLRGPADQIAAALSQTPVRGEVTVVMAGLDAAAAAAAREDVAWERADRAIAALLQAGLGVRQVRDVVADLADLPRKAVYTRALAAAQEPG